MPNEIPGAIRREGSARPTSLGSKYFWKNVLRFEDTEEKMKQDIIISGDTVFAGSVGRVDLTGGTNMQDLVGNITRRLLCLKDETILFPGHGPHTTIEVEKQSNPYLMGNL